MSPHRLRTHRELARRLLPSLLTSALFLGCGGVTTSSGGGQGVTVVAGGRCDGASARGTDTSGRSCTCESSKWVCKGTPPDGEACSSPGETKRAYACGGCVCDATGRWNCFGSNLFCNPQDAAPPPPKPECTVGCVSDASPPPILDAGPLPNVDAGAPRGCGARLGNTCRSNEYCAYEPGQMCGAADASATCKPRPSGCTLEYAPVCGCDGNTYGNACGAAAAGTGVNTTGPCSGG